MAQFFPTPATLTFSQACPGCLFPTDPIGFFFSPAAQGDLQSKLPGSARLIPSLRGPAAPKEYKN